VPGYFQPVLRALILGRNPTFLVIQEDRAPDPVGGYTAILA
jgi:hypothetical protein